MEKSPDAFRTISEVADLLDTPAHVLRFWESRFPQVRPVKRAGGRRYYRPADIALLAGIRHLLHDQGMTIRGVQKMLREQGVRHVGGLGGSATGLALDGVVLPGSDGADPTAAAPDMPGPDAAPSDPGLPPSDAPVTPEDDAPAGRVIPWPGAAAPMAAPAPEAEPAPASQPAAEPAPVAGTDPALAALPGDAGMAPPATPGPAAAAPAQTVQGDLFSDLPLFRQGHSPAVAAPPAAMHTGAEPATPTEPAVPDQAAPPAATAAPAADIRALVVRIRQLPPGALAQAGLAEVVAGLSALRDRMKAPPSGHAS